MPRRETCVQAPPVRSLACRPDWGVPSSSRAWRRLAVVQAPITLSVVEAVRQLAGISTASEVTFLSDSSPNSLTSLVPFKALALASLVMTLAGALTRSKMRPRLTEKASLRWPTKTRPGVLQPGMVML